MGITLGIAIKLLFSLFALILTIIFFLVRPEKLRRRWESNKEPPYRRRKKDENPSILPVNGSKIGSGIKLRLPPFVAKLTDTQAQNQMEINDVDIKNDEKFKERIRKEIEKVFEGFNKREYDELITQYQMDHEKYQEDIAREEKEQHDRKIDADRQKQIDKFEEQREREIKELHDKDKADRQKDFTNSTKFIRSAFAGNTVFDDALWMTASVVNLARIGILDIYKLWKLKHDINNVKAEFLKKTEDIERKADANRKSLVELKNEYKRYDDTAKRIDALQRETGLFNREERKNLQEQLKVALGNRDFIKERMIERGCNGANELDKHLKEIEEQLEKCKLLRDGADRERTEISKEISELKKDVAQAYLSYQDAMKEGLEVYQKEKNNMEIAKDLVEQHKEIEKSISELKLLHDDAKTKGAERNEIEREINYLREKQERIVEQFERRSGLERGSMNDAEYVSEVEKKYLSYEAKQNMEAYSKEFESHFKEYDSEIRKCLEQMNGKDFANMIEKSRELSQENLHEMEKKLESYSVLRYSVDEYRNNTLNQLRNEYQQISDRIFEYKNELENPAITTDRKEELERTVQAAERHKDTLQEEMTSLSGEKQPNYSYKDYERTVRNSYDTELNDLDKKIEQLSKDVSDIKTYQQEQLQNQDHDNVNEI